MITEKGDVETSIGVKDYNAFDTLQEVAKRFEERNRSYELKPRTVESVESSNLEIRNVELERKGLYKECPVFGFTLKKEEGNQEIFAYKSPQIPQNEFDEFKEMLSEEHRGIEIKF